MKGKKRRYKKLIESERISGNLWWWEKSKTSLGRHIENKLKNRANKKKFIDLTFMDLSGYDLDISNLKIDGFYASEVKAESEIYNDNQKSGEIMNYDQKANIIDNADQKGDSIFNCRQQAKVKIENGNQNAKKIHN